MKWKKYKSYLLSVAISLAVGGIAAVFTTKGMSHFQMQKKPWFQPPNALFPIAWTCFYILMGISAARIAKSSDPKKKQALQTYALQLGFNFFWSIFFFTLHWYLFSFFWLLLLIGLIVKMIKEFSEIDPPAAKLQLPYLLWCCFAAVLNFSVWFLNR